MISYWLPIFALAITLLTPSQLKQQGQGYPESIAWSPDGKTLALCASAGVWLYAASFDIPPQLLNVQGPCYSAKFSPDGNTIVTVSSSEQVITRWDARSNVVQSTLPFSSVEDTVFSPDGTTLAYSYYDSARKTGIVGLWDISKAASRQIAEIPKKVVRVLTFNPDGTVLAGSIEDGGFPLTNFSDLGVWSVTSGDQLRSFDHAVDHKHLAFSPDGKNLASSDGDGLHLWNTKSFTLQATYPGYYDTRGGIAFSPDGAILATICRLCYSNKLRLLNAKTLKLETILGDEDFPPLDSTASLVFSPDGTTLAAINRDGVEIWDVKSGKRRTTVRLPDAQGR